MFVKQSKLQVVLQAIMQASSARRLAESRNKLPALGGTYGTYGRTLIVGDWTR